MTVIDSRPASHDSASMLHAPAGPDSLGGQRRNDAHGIAAAEGITSPQAMPAPVPGVHAPAGMNDSLGGHTGSGIQSCRAAEGNASPPITLLPAATELASAGNKTGRSQEACDAHASLAAADDFPGAQRIRDLHTCAAAGEQAPVPTMPRSASIASSSAREQSPPAARTYPQPTERPLLADPLLALAADVLDDLEKVQIANENRLRQFTRSVQDRDGETRGFGLDESHPDIARLAALVQMLADAEHKAVLNLQRLMRKHPLGPWVAAQKGIGEKQGARLIAAIGDPYIRPEMALEDGTVVPARPRTVSELWALCGYHVVPADQVRHVNHGVNASGGADGSGPGHTGTGAQGDCAGVAPKRQRGQKANWSATAKMRAYLVAESCMKQPTGTRYRDVYEATRAKYADAGHAIECIRCGPKGKPALPGSPLSDGHKHARALRAVAKEVLKDLWREAKRIHEGLPAVPTDTSAPI